jgi:hypothetical protein
MKLNKSFIYLLVNSFLCIYFFGLNYVYLVYSILIYLIIKYLNNNIIISLVLGLISIILKFISFYDNYIILDDYYKVILTTNYFNFLNNLYFKIKTNIYYYTGYRISPDANQFPIEISLLSGICNSIKNFFNYFFNYFGNNTKIESSPPRKESRFQDEPIPLDNLMDFLHEYEAKQAREQAQLELIENSRLAQQAAQKAKEEAIIESAFASLKKEKKIKIEQQQQLNTAQDNQNKLDEQILESAYSSLKELESEQKAKDKSLNNLIALLKKKEQEADSDSIFKEEQINNNTQDTVLNEADLNVLLQQKEREVLTLSKQIQLLIEEELNNDKEDTLLTEEAISALLQQKEKEINSILQRIKEKQHVNFDPSLKEEKKIKEEQADDTATALLIEENFKAQESKIKDQEDVSSQKEITSNDDMLALMQENKETSEYDIINKVVLEEVVDEAVIVEENSEESDLLAINFFLEEDEVDDATDILSL